MLANARSGRALSRNSAVAATGWATAAYVTANPDADTPLEQRL